MLKDMRITKKLPIIMITFALISALTTGFIAYKQAATAMEIQAKEKLYSLLQSRESALEQYFENISKDISYHSQSSLIQSSLGEFSAAWKELPSNKQAYLQKQYISDNPFPLGKKMNLLKAKDSSVYSETHEKYHASFTSLISAGNYYDVFLIDETGNIIYSVGKENDFATNLLQGKWVDSGIADTFKKIVNNPLASELIFTDFLPYAPNNNVPASFIGTASFDDEGVFAGAFILQLSIDKLNSVMQVTAGMGESGETYLVGRDLTMRSDSRFFKGRSILKTKVDTVPVNNAFAGEEGVTIAQDYRDISVYSAYKPFDFLATRWAILAEVDEEEVLRPVNKLNQLLTLAGVIIALAIAVFGYVISSDLASPIRSMTKTMKQLANNDLTVNISVNERKDEVGSMALALVEFKNFALEREQLRKHLSHVAKHDALTGLPNRENITGLLQEMLEQTQKSGSSLSVMFADLDGFKRVNDNYGHLCGDELLKQVADRLKYSLRPEDVVARIGGDEFLVVLPNIDNKDDCEKIADRIIHNVGKEYSLFGETLNMGISLGAATSPVHSTKLDELLNIADKAMYKAKTRGKNRLVYYVDKDMIKSAG